MGCPSRQHLRELLWAWTRLSLHLYSTAHRWVRWHVSEVCERYVSNIKPSTKPSTETCNVLVGGESEEITHTSMTRIDDEWDIDVWDKFRRYWTCKDAIEWVKLSSKKGIGLWHRRQSLAWTFCSALSYYPKIQRNINTLCAVFRSNARINVHKSFRFHLSMSMI